MALLRFAPSPTGSLHLGGLRTALFNHLLARKLGGTWLLRIEDTDATRYDPQSVAGIKAGLQWAGIAPENADAPYYQSQRLDLYHEHAKKLLDQRLAYRCFCSPDTLAETRQRLSSLGSNATYDRTCLHLTDEEVHRRLRAGHKHVVRLLDTAVPTRPSIADMVFGAFKDVHTSLSTDTVLLKSDNFPTYHLASVIDDHDMGVTHVVRGEEWLASLPLHLDLYACFGWKPPEFGHLPLLLNADGTKMSKRASGWKVSSFEESGFEPEAVLNWLFLLGLSTSTHDEEVFRLEEMLQRFDLNHFSTHRAILDRSKLLHLNRSHIRRKAEEDDPKLLSRTQRVIKEELGTDVSVDEARTALKFAGDRVEVLPQLPAIAGYLFVEPNYASTEARKLKKSIPSEIYRQVCSDLLAALHPAPIITCMSDGNKAYITKLGDANPSLDTDDLHERWAAALASVRNALMKNKTASPKQIMATLRHALTGMEHGPPLAEIVQALPPYQILWRLARGSFDGAQRREIGLDAED
ncbi:hypothetical protein EXIGLDRAFT_738698 [Exidia glandulosa HHB12029]|uniref:glutamate--tRNA ligase n=1 Tax=Exidia glandulosa HHB12029 TaxID=1314781 RepID=A0A165NGW4_EXIGL|nr:hypothetical protein EXIGLDRAFT_738698 [Exidia glandulosa HHB12029]